MLFRLSNETMGILVTLILLLASSVMTQTQYLGSDVAINSTETWNSTARWTTQEAARDTTTDKYYKDLLKRYAIPTVPAPTPYTNSYPSRNVFGSTLPTLLILFLTSYWTA